MSKRTLEDKLETKKINLEEIHPHQFGGNNKTFTKYPAPKNVSFHNKTTLLMHLQKERKLGNVKTYINSMLYKKYSSSQNYHYLKDINDILCLERSPATFVYKQMEDVLNISENLDTYFGLEDYKTQMEDVVEYYKYHHEIPRCFGSKIFRIYFDFYDKKRKLNYERITRKIKLENGEDPDIDQKNDLAMRRMKAYHPVLMDLTRSWLNPAEKKQKKDELSDTIDVIYKQLNGKKRSEESLSLSTPKSINSISFHFSEISSARLDDLRQGRVQGAPDTRGQDVDHRRDRLSGVRTENSRKEMSSKFAKNAFFSSKAEPSEHTHTETNPQASPLAEPRLMNFRKKRNKVEKMIRAQRDKPNTGGSSKPKKKKKSSRRSEKGDQEPIKSLSKRRNKSSKLRKQGGQGGIGGLQKKERNHRKTSSTKNLTVTGVIKKLRIKEAKALNLLQKKKSSPCITGLGGQGGPQLSEVASDLMVVVAGQRRRSGGSKQLGEALGHQRLRDGGAKGAQSHQNSKDFGKLKNAKSSKNFDKRGFVNFLSARGKLSKSTQLSPKTPAIQIDQKMKNSKKSEKGQKTKKKSERGSKKGLKSFEKSINGLSSLKQSMMRKTLGAWPFKKLTSFRSSLKAQLAANQLRSHKSKQGLHQHRGQHGVKERSVKQSQKSKKEQNGSEYPQKDFKEFFGSKRSPGGSRHVPGSLHNYVVLSRDSVKVKNPKKRSNDGMRRFKSFDEVDLMEIVVIDKINIKNAGGRTSNQFKGIKKKKSLELGTIENKALGSSKLSQNNSGHSAGMNALSNRQHKRSKSDYLGLTAKSKFKSSRVSQHSKKRPSNKISSRESSKRGALASHATSPKIQSQADLHLKFSKKSLISSTGNLNFNRFMMKTPDDFDFNNFQKLKKLQKSEFGKPGARQPVSVVNAASGNHISKKFSSSKRRMKSTAKYSGFDEDEFGHQNTVYESHINRGRGSAKDQEGSSLRLKKAHRGKSQKNQKSRHKSKRRVSDSSELFNNSKKIRSLAGSRSRKKSFSKMGGGKNKRKRSRVKSSTNVGFMTNLFEKKKAMKASSRMFKSKKRKKGHISSARLPQNIIYESFKESSDLASKEKGSGAGLYGRGLGADEFDE